MRLIGPISIVAVMVSGCALPQHSNTLLFATNTAVALDVSTNATTAAPNITLGYKRQEMAWVPLLANKSGPDKERQPADCPPAANGTDSCVFQGKDGNSLDAYSVLATFAGSGAASGSKGTTSSTSASGSIAQFFATGLAARMLAEKGGAQLVNSGATQNADQIINMWQQVEQSDDQKLNAYFGGGGNFTQQRDALVNNSQWKGTPTATSLQQQADVVSFMNYARVNFLTHSLAAAIPAGTTAPAAAPAAAATPAATAPAITPPATKPPAAPEDNVHKPGPVN
jgi:hypothetical protein